jgi:hypothetical protein
MFLETIDLLNREINYCENCNIQEQSIVINSSFGFLDKNNDGKMPCSVRPYCLVMNQGNLLFLRRVMPQLHIL